MHHVRTTSVLFLLAALLVTAFLPDRPVHAGVILAVGDPQNNGVMVFDGRSRTSGPRRTPRHTRVPATGAQPQHAGVADEALVGSLGKRPGLHRCRAYKRVLRGDTHLDREHRGRTEWIAGDSSVADPGQRAARCKHGALHRRQLVSANQTYTFNNFSVGSEFDFWAGLLGDGNGDYQMMVTLSIQPALGLGSPAPEPSSLVLLSSAIAPMLVAGPSASGKGG